MSSVSSSTMAANGASVIDDRAGIAFGVERYVPWDAPEAVVDVSSAGVVPLRNVPGVIGLVGRREGTVESRVLQGRDARSVRVLVPDCRGIDQNFHDVTIVDMGDVPESHISLPELSTCRRRSLTTWGGVNGNWKRCARRRIRGSSKVVLLVIRSAGFSSSATCIGTWRAVIWTWLSCGGAQCRGAPCGRARHRTVWTTSAEPMMCRGR